MNVTANLGKSTNNMIRQFNQTQMRSIPVLTRETSSMAPETIAIEPTRANVTAPGERVLVDQIMSPTPGFIAQMVGRLTSKRYTCATLFVDNATGYRYVWLQTSTSASETLQGKEAFEREANDAGIEIKEY